MMPPRGVYEESLQNFQVKKRPGTEKKVSPQKQQEQKLDVIRKPELWPQLQSANATITTTKKKKKRLWEKLENYFDTTGHVYEGDLWELSDYLPPWMKDYFAWHKLERETINVNNWHVKNLFIIQCMDGVDKKCGGAADRLKPMAYLIRKAAETQRVLFIYWSKPHMLEEFLVPPQGGIDWRTPEWLQQILIHKSRYGRRHGSVDAIEAHLDAKTALFRTRLQQYDSGTTAYNNALLQGESKFEDVYHDMWQILFRPSPPVEAIIQNVLQSNHLVPGDYVTAHVRALYAEETEKDWRTQKFTEFSLNCSSTLRPGKPIFLASDSSLAIDLGIAYGKSHGGVVVTHQSDPDPPLHLDMTNITMHKVSDYYDTFVDLYLMSLGRCGVTTMGGYGSWSLLIGGAEASCHYRIKKLKTKYKCDWQENSPKLEPSTAHSHSPVFLPAMT